ncbi:IS66 family transposase, partial [Mesorhizobium sp. M7A.F.Ca.MR.228.00.0.0]
MLIDLENLPSDPQLLQRLVRDMAAAVESRDGEIERLQSIIKKLQRAQFGRSSEQLAPDQLVLALEDLD